jgi:hypothetical protein
VRVVGDPAQRTVAVSKIIGAWYKTDFGADEARPNPNSLSLNPKAYAAKP